MNIKKIQPAFKDDRGEITDVISMTPVEHVTIIHSEKGAVRGNHYHRNTIQFLYIISGSIRCVARKLDDEEKIEAVLRAGDLYTSYPNESHAFQALEETTWLVLTHGPRGGRDYENDTFRLKEPLIP